MASKKETTKSTENSRSLIDDLERSGEAIATEVVKHLQTVRVKVVDAAHTVSDKTLAVKDKVTGEETRKRLLELADDVEEGGKYVLEQLTEIVGALHKRVTDTVEGLTKMAPKRAPVKKKAKKKTKKKKANPKKITKKQAAKKVSKKKAKKKAAKITVRKTKTGKTKVAGKKKRTKTRTAKRQ